MILFKKVIKFIVPLITLMAGVVSVVKYFNPKYHPPLTLPYSNIFLLLLTGFFAYQWWSEKAHCIHIKESIISNADFNIVYRITREQGGCRIMCLVGSPSGIQTSPALTFQLAKGRIIKDLKHDFGSPLKISNSKWEYQAAPGSAFLFDIIVQKTYAGAFLGVVHIDLQKEQTISGQIFLH